MNERIKLLAEQASHQNSYGYPVTIPYSKDFAEKFAELIIRECAQVAADFVPGYGLVPFSKRFNEHYGVEE